MKKILSVSALLLTFFLLKAQKPSDFAKVTGTYYLGKFEVSNNNYKKFLDHLQQTKQNELYSKCAPDTMLWAKGNNKPYAEYYFSYPAYANYPVLGVTYESVIEYCKWLTDEYNSNTKREFRKVLFRLPTEEEWAFAANGGNKNKVYTWNSPYVLDEKKGYMCNFLRVGDNKISYDASANSLVVVNAEQRNSFPQDRAAIPAPVQSFQANQFGIYNMCGNVAEMVREKGIAKGGSYNDPGYDVRIASVKQYKQPSVEIGFRVAMEVVEK